MKLLFSVILHLALVLPIAAQNVPIDYETGGNGATWTWTVFENDSNPPLEIVANPDVSGLNTSCTVAKFTALQAGNPWAGCETMHGAGIGSWTIGPNNSTIKILVWKDVISDVGIKLVRFDNWSLGEIKIPNTVVNQWEEITFDFSSHSGNTYDQIVIFPDFQARSSDNVIYFDHVYGDASGAVGCGCIPANAPPVPDSASLSPVYGNCSVDSLNAPTATDSCGNTIMGMHNANLPITTVGTTPVTWTYTDNGGNTATQMQDVVVTCATGLLDSRGYDVTLYPNPAQERIMLSLGELRQGDIVVYDVMGRALLNQRFESNQVEISLGQLPAAGTYFAKVRDAQGNLVAVKTFLHR